MEIKVVILNQQGKEQGKELEKDEEAEGSSSAG